MFTTMTALSRKDGGVRGIATGTSFRRLVAKSLAMLFGAEAERVCVPFQFALSTRAGTDCVGHAVRLATDLDPRATVLSIDGVGAYDHVGAGQCWPIFLLVESLRGLLPTFGQHMLNHRAVIGKTIGRVRHPTTRRRGARRSIDATAFLDDVCALLAQSGHGRSTSCRRKNCSPQQASGCTLARPEHGTEQVRSQRAWKSWETKCGTPQGSRSWGLQSVRKNSTLLPRERLAEEEV